MTPTAEPRSHDWALLGGAVLATVGILWLVIALPAAQRAFYWAVDLAAYREAAMRLVDGTSLYAPRSLTGPFHPFGSDLYLYPPPVGIALAPLGRLSLAASGVLWYGLHVAAIAVACLLMPVRRPLQLAAIGLAAFSYAVLRDLTVGNVSSMLLLPMAAAWRWLDRPAGSIAIAIAACVRASFGVFFAWQALRRVWRPLAWTMAAATVLVLAGAAFVGLGGYRDYLTMLGNVVTAADLKSSDLAATALWLGAAPGDAWVAVCAGWVVGIAAVVASLRRDPEVSFMVTLGASLLLAPLMWEHYLALVILPAAFLASRGHPWALALPVLTWLPRELLAFVAIAATLLPFLARDADTHPASPTIGLEAAPSSSSTV